MPPAPAESSSAVEAERWTADHAQAAAREVEQGRLEDVLAQARVQLGRDLDELRAALDAAGDAPAEWRKEREAELEALSREVREKPERIESVRRWLAALLPRLRLITRALATAQRLQAAERHFDPRSTGTAEAARLSLLLELRSLWGLLLPQAGDGRAPQRPRQRVRTRWLVAAAVAVAAAIAGVAIALSGGSGSNTNLAATATPTTTTTPTTTSTTIAPVRPPQPRVAPVSAVFDPAQRATFYTAAARATEEGTPTYAWRLTPPRNDPNCNTFGPVPGSPNRAVWHHADTDGCSHVGVQHLGLVTVTITTSAWRCTAQFLGTLTRTGPPPQRCRPR